MIGDFSATVSRITYQRGIENIVWGDINKRIEKVNKIREQNEMTITSTVFQVHSTEYLHLKY